MSPPERKRGERTQLCIDLGIGLGGASAAFVDAGWEVVGLDLDRRLRPTVCADYSRLPFRTGFRPKVILAAPDCSCFSIMALRYHWAKTPDGPMPKDKRTLDAIDDTLHLVQEIKRLKPDYAVLENPVGMMRRVLGKPQHTIRMSDYGSRFKKPTDLWEFGRKRLQFVWLAVMGDWIHIPRKKGWRRKDRMGIQGVKSSPWPAPGDRFYDHSKNERQWPQSHAGTDWENTIRAKSIRAKWPYGLSQAILEAVEQP